MRLLQPAACALLIDPGFGYADGQLAHAADDADSFGHADRAARVERIEEIAALQHVIVGGEQRKAALSRS